MGDPAVSLTVNGRPVRAEARRLLIHVLRDLGVRVPTLCHDDRLTPYGGCRICVVDRRDTPAGLVPACATRVQAGMVIETDSAAVVQARQRQLQLILLNHRADCPVCEVNSDCRLQDLVHEIGLPAEVLPLDQHAIERDESSPVIIRDPGKCIVCGRCVRLCEEVQGVAALALVGRGFSTRVTPFFDRPLDCEFCGQCVNACPVGALVARPYINEVATWQRSSVRTTCSFCACGCEVAIEQSGGRLVRVAAREDQPHNRGKLCVKGWLGLDVTTHPDRLTSPLIRRGGMLVETGWEEALATAADGLRRAAGRGPVMVAGSGRLSCEDGYILQALAREVLRTPHVDVAPAGGTAALVDGLGRIFDRPRSTVGFDELRRADLVLVVGCDPTRSHPLLKTELVQAVVQRGLELHVANPVPGGLDRFATGVHRVAPGATHDLLSSLAARLLAVECSPSAGFRSLSGADGWCQSLEVFTGETAERATGIAADRIEALADRLAGARFPVVVIATGIGFPGDEAAAARAAASLVALLGSRAGVMVLGGRPNTQGLVDVGLHPRLLPGHLPVERAAELEALTGRTTVSLQGWSLEEWVAAGHKAVSGLLLVGVDPVDLLPGGEASRRALEGAGFTVVVDAFPSHGVDRADVVLPVALLAEREGTMVGADGVRRPLRRALTPPAGVRSDTEVLAELALRMGGGLPTSAELVDEMERVVGWTWSRPTARELPPALHPRAAAIVSGFFLDAAPQLFHSGSTTTKSAMLQELSPTVAARLNPTDARALGVARGEVVAISGGGGEILLRARLDRTIGAGSVGVSWVGSRHGASTLQTGEDEVFSVKVRKA